MSQSSAHSTIAFQGVLGANSHLICQRAYPNMQPLPCTSFEDAFSAVRQGDARLAMIPIENTLGGRVADIHHLLPESRLAIIGEQFLQVEYQLLAPKNASLETVKAVHSHPQALAQCRGLIRALQLEPVSHADTAGAAKDVARRNEITEAAIAPALAGEIYGLTSLRSRIEDRLDNTTRFVVLATHRSDPPPDLPSITSVLFQVRSVPAALYKALGGFATNGVNVVKLESYITDSAFTVAQFYAEVEGHISTRPVDQALQELQYFSDQLKVLGVYPAHPYRLDHLR